MSFPDLPGLAHHKSPQTSHDAAAQLVNAGTNRREVFLHIARSLERGMTADALEVATGLEGNTVRPRIQELMNFGLIEYGERKEKTRKGRDAAVLVLTAEGIELAMEEL